MATGDLDLPIADFADLDLLLDEISDDSDVLPAVSRETFPDIATRLRLWQLCHRVGCRAKRRCCGDQTACVRRHRIPPYVLAWFLDMREACRESDFKEALNEVDLEFTTAVNAWCAALAAVETHAHRRAPRHRSAPAARRRRVTGRRTGGAAMESKWPGRARP